MVALLFILACIAVLTAAFTIVIRQMAEAHRQHYLEEVEVNDLACALQPELERKIARNARPRQRSARSSRRRITHAPAGHPHSSLMIR